MARARWRVALLVAWLATIPLAGCALRRPRFRPAPAMSAGQLLGALAVRRAAVTSLRARVRLRAGLRGAWTRQALLVRRPDAVRIDVLSPFGLALAVGVHDSLLWAFPPSQGVRYEGAATPENVGRFLGAPVAVPDVVDLLLGLPPARTPTGPAVVATTPAGEIALTLPLGDGAQTVWFAGDPLTVVRAEERRGDALALQVTFGDHEAGFPRSLDIAAPASGAEARLRYEAIESNVPLDLALFAPPPAERVLPLEAAQ